MIKTIKHIISLFAITSVLALSFMGCEQPTTPEVKDTVAPAEVSDLKAVTGDTKVTLSWKNPTDEDFFNVIITYDGKTKQTQADGTNSIDITGLENGKAYTFKVQTVDDKKNMSSGRTIEHIYNPYNLTLIPKKVNTQEITVNDKTKTYDIVEFGDWPQTKIKKGINIVDTSTTININGWDCYKGSDEAYYAKVKATPYYKVNSDNDPNEDTTKYKFDDGTTIEKDNEYYFKLEPIQWRVLTNDYKIPDRKNENGTNKYKSSGKKLLFAEKTLAAICFNKATENIGTEPDVMNPNVYKESFIRAYLINDFINTAFTPAAIAKIEETDVDNSWESIFGTGETFRPSNCKRTNTKDKIFLLSKKEVTAAEYGFDSYMAFNREGTVRTRKATDYARATGAWVTSQNRSCFWLRSPVEHFSDEVFFVNADGMAYHYSPVNDSSFGVVPALTISSY